MTIKMFQVEYGSKAPSMLRYHKHARIETSTTGGGSIALLARSSSTFPEYQGDELLPP